MIFRLLDILIAFSILFISLPILFILVLGGWVDTGKPVFIQKRMGREFRWFYIFKFRSMKVDTLDLPTHLVPETKVTRWGAIIRSTKLDELPQLLNVLKGDMCLVGPRPCLVDQRKLIEERSKRGIFSVKPGITGYGQLRGVTMDKPRLLARFDAVLIKNMSVGVYFELLILTVLQILKKILRGKL